MRDSHVHTHYCPHGSDDEMSLYVEEAIKKGISILSFTEHAPFPKTFTDPLSSNDSAMSWNDVPQYIHRVQQLQKEYKKHIEIRLGFEVDYLIGEEASTKEVLNEIGPYMEDGILSVHFLRIEDDFRCIDFSSEMFGDIVQQLGSVERVHELYYKTVAQSVQADLGAFKPTRIGHMTLVHKFIKDFPLTSSTTTHWLPLLQLIKERGYTLDYNSAGFRKERCGEPYPNDEVMNAAQQLHIPFVYGSDAHCSKDIGSNFNLLQTSKIHTRL